jgi:hypothetical protein
VTSAVFNPRKSELSALAVNGIEDTALQQQKANKYLTFS